MSSATSLCNIFERKSKGECGYEMVPDFKLVAEMIYLNRYNFYIN